MKYETKETLEQVLKEFVERLRTVEMTPERTEIARRALACRNRDEMIDILGELDGTIELA